MKQKEANLSSRNAFARFMMGSVMTAFGTARLMRNPKSRSAQMLVLFGAMKAAEGATKYCPTKAMSSNMMQKITGGSSTQGAQANAGASMNSGTHAGQKSGSFGQIGGNIMQMAGNVAQKFMGGNASQSALAAAQSMGGIQTMSGSAGQNTSGANANGNTTQQMKSGTAAQAIGSIAQNLAPQVGQIISGVTGMTGSQNASGTNTAKQASSISGSSTASTNNAMTKSASTTNSSTNKQTSASQKNNTNTQQPNATKTMVDGSANLSSVDPSIINESSKTNSKNVPTSNILQ